MSGRLSPPPLAGDIGPVDLLAQIAAGSVLHEGQKRGQIEGHAPGAVFRRGLLLPACAGHARGQAQGILGQAGDMVFLRQGQDVGLGGVEHVVGEAGGQFGQFLAHGIETLPVFGREAHALQGRVADEQGYGALQGLAQGREFRALPQGDEGVVDRAALAQPVVELHDQGLGLGVGLAHVRGVFHVVQVR